MRIGIIGTGAMGQPMARNILKTDTSLFIFARHPEKVDGLIQKGATVVQSPAKLAAECDMIVLSLPFDPDVEQVLLGVPANLCAWRANHDRTTTINHILYHIIHRWVEWV